MKDVKNTLLDRRSIRRYQYDPIDPETMDFIIEAIRNTPTSYNGQQFSVIEVADQSVKEQLYDITGQKQIKTCSRFLMFLADYHKIEILAQEKGITMDPFYNTADGLTVGIVDAALAMMSAIVAAESRGIGTCPIGYARTADPARISSILHLPQHVFAVCGLALGLPRELPDLKPKQPAGLTVMLNRYADDDELLPHLKAYDNTIRQYNMTRQGGTTTDHDWCGHIIDYYREAENFNMLDAMRHRGFDIKK